MNVFDELSLFQIKQEVTLPLAFGNIIVENNTSTKKFLNGAFKSCRGFDLSAHGPRCAARHYRFGTRL